MWFSLSDQTVYFLASIALGAALAAAYDLLRALRMLLRSGRGAVMVMDVVFFALCGVVTSLFALPFNKGNVRGFIVFGEAGGFLAYRLTLGSIFGKIHAALSRLLRQFIRKIGENLKKIYDFLLKAVWVVLYNILESIVGFFRTAVSGVGVLTSEFKEARGDRLRKSNKKRKDHQDIKERAYERKNIKARHKAGRGRRHRRQQ